MIFLNICADMITHLQEKLQPMIIPAILEHEAISGLTSHKPAGKIILSFFRLSFEVDTNENYLFILYCVLIISSLLLRDAR